MWPRLGHKLGRKTGFVDGDKHYTIPVALVAPKGLASLCFVSVYQKPKPKVCIVIMLRGGLRDRHAMAYKAPSMSLSSVQEGE